MKKYLIIAGLVILALVVFLPKNKQFGGAVTDFRFSDATMATSSVGTTWSVSPVMSKNSSRGFASFCNQGVTANQAIFLGYGATTSLSGLGMSGRMIPSQQCYEMNLGNMFVGDIYAVATPSTSTVLMIYK